MVGESQAPCITFEDISYAVQSNSDAGVVKLLLNRVTGYVEPGRVTALIGSSGCGKTTLLDVLSGRATARGNISGVVKYDGHVPSPDYLKRHMAYVEQENTLIGCLTVREMLMYTAELKYPLSVPHSAKVAAVEQVLDRLGLTECQHVKIGTAFIKGISGGQAKRTNIAIALLGDRRVLFLDEPTSGLDSFSASEVVDLLHSLSGNVTVLCSIHSPSAQAFARFDRVMLMAKGQCLYLGPNGQAVSAFTQELWPVKYRQSVECSLAEYLLEAVKAADRDNQVQALADTYAASELFQANLKVTQQYANAAGTASAATAAADSAELQQISVKLGPDALPESPHTAADSSPAQQGRTTCCGYATTPSWWQWLVLMKYRTRVNVSNPEWVIARVADKVIFVLLIITMYLQTGGDYSLTNLTGMQGSLFMFIAMPAASATAFIPAIIQERRLFQRERGDGLYFVASYFLHKLSEELLMAALVSIVFASASFYGVGYQGSFALFWLSYLLILMIGMVLGYLDAALCPSLELATILLPTYVITLFFLAGQLAVKSAVPVYWRWYIWCNPLHYAWTANMLNQFGVQDPVYTSDGRTVLEYYELDGGHAWANIAVVVAFFVGYSFLAYLALAFMRHNKR